MKKITRLLLLLALVATFRGKSQVTLFYEDWSSNSFSPNGWVFPTGQGNWDIGSSFTPFYINSPNAYFQYSPTYTNYSFSLLSPTISATGYPGQNLTLSYLLRLDNFSNLTLEEFKVEYKDVASSTWITLNAYDNATVTAIEDYSVIAAPLTGMGGQNFQIRFTAFGANSYNINGWGLDSILVEAPMCPTIPSLEIFSSPVVCNGVASNLIAGGANSYTWMPGGSNDLNFVDYPTTVTEYTLTGEIIGCPTITLSPLVYTVNVNPSPTVAITANFPTICQGQNSTLTASGANTYSWISIPSTTLSTTTGSVIIVSPPAKETFTLVGIASNGCTDTTDQTINVDEVPTIVSLAATPTAVCGGGNSQLSSLGVLTDNYTVYPVPYSVINTPSSGVVTLCNAGVANVIQANGNLDDGDWENINLPFTFNFFSSGYNSLAITTNGFISLGSGQPYTYYGYPGTFPDPFSARPCIAAAYSELSFYNQGTIEYFTVGSAPNRTFVVNWSNGEFGTSSGTVTTQVKLMETSNVIEIHTGNISGNPFFYMVEGIQDQTASNAFTAPNRNFAIYTVSSPDAYRFEPNGAASPSYSWSPATFLSSTSVSSPSVTGITATTVYSVTATGLNGCTATQTIQINAGPTVPTLSISSTPSVICNNGGNATLTASGAVSVYQWNTGAATSSISVTQTATTVYTLTAFNSTGCDITETISLAVYGNPTIAAVASSNTLCFGNSANLNAAGASTYSWSNGGNMAMTMVTPSATTSYSVVGYSINGCSDTAIVLLTVNPLPIVNLTASSNTVCVNGVSLTLSGSPSGGTYSGTDVQSNGVFIPGTVAGTYTPVYSVTNSTTGCTGTASVMIVVDPCTGISENNNELQGVSVYPNPNNGEFYVELNNGFTKKITLMDITGRKLYNTETTEGKTGINISDLPGGIYTLKIGSNQSIKVVKIVRE